MFIITIIIIYIPITEQSVRNRLAENQPKAGLSSLNEHERMSNEYENGMEKFETELVFILTFFKSFFVKVMDFCFVLNVLGNI